MATYTGGNSSSWSTAPVAVDWAIGTDCFFPDRPEEPRPPDPDCRHENRIPHVTVSGVVVSELCVDCNAIFQKGHFLDDEEEDYRLL